MTIKVTLFSNGNTVAYENGKQIPGAQEPWILSWAEIVRANGIDPTTLEITTPDGKEKRIVEDDDGVLNWKGV